MSLVTLKKSHLESELVVHNSQLEAAVIACYFKNEFTTQIMNYLPSFEVELQVSEFDLDKAHEIVNNRG